MVHAGGDAGFALEPGAQCPIRSGRAEGLDRNRPLQPVIERRVDDAHSTFTKGPRDPIASDEVAHSAEVYNVAHDWADRPNGVRSRFSQSAVAALRNP